MKRDTFLLIGFCVLTINICQAQNYLQEGNTCFDKGDYKCATKNYSAEKANGTSQEMDKKIEKADNCFKILTVANYLFSDEKAYAKAKSKYEELLKINPKDPYAKKQLELCNKELGVESSDSDITDATQQNNIAFSYYYDEKNYTEAIKWFRKSAEQGFAKAQLMTGYMYYAKEGVAQDYVEAVSQRMVMNLPKKL